MAKFDEVFSITWKVLLSLFLISLATGVVYFFVAGMGSVSRRKVVEDDEWQRNYRNTSADDAPTKMPRSQWNTKLERCVVDQTVIEGMTKGEVKQAVAGDGVNYSITVAKGTCQRYNGEECIEYSPDQNKTFVLSYTPNDHLIWNSDSIGLSVYGKYIDLSERNRKNKAEAMALAQQEERKKMATVKKEEEAQEAEKQKQIAIEMQAAAIRQAEQDSEKAERVRHLTPEEACWREGVGCSEQEQLQALARQETKARSWHSQYFCEQEHFVWRDGLCHAK
jgi:hypothetical protein